MSIDDMVGRVADQLEVAYFATVAEGRQWLMGAGGSQPPSAGGLAGRLERF